MEHREPPRIPMSEGPPRDATDPLNARRFGRFVTPKHVRRIAPSRIGLAVFAVISAVIFMVIIGMRLIHSATDWLQGQPTYQIKAESVQFEPPLPPWYKGGTKAFLERAKIGLDSGTTQSALSLDPAALSKELTLNCWAKGVVGVRQEHPNKLVIKLNMRNPVALAKLPDGTHIIIDEDGVLLPRSEIDDTNLDVPLMILVGFGEGPKSRQPGLNWKRSRGGGELDEPDERIVAAAKLAAFIREVQGKGRDLTGKQRFALVAPQGEQNKLAIRNEMNLWVAWVEAPGQESVGKPSAKEKWEKVVKWIKEHGPRDIRPGEYLYFSKTGIGYGPN
ncbi:hypothetical protein [Singulisphaera sp. PoT]|uniref:hypothetical protein n=1 Tax=Singulisphaera sp. PoT TaxID=3411797 RepID=UPI003BF580D8